MMRAEFTDMMWNLFRISQPELDDMFVKFPVTRTRKKAENEQKKLKTYIGPNGIMGHALSAVDPEYVRMLSMDRGFTTNDILEDLRNNLGVTTSRRNLERWINKNGIRKLRFNDDELDDAIRVRRMKLPGKRPQSEKEQANKVYQHVIL